MNSRTPSDLHRVKRHYLLKRLQETAKQLSKEAVVPIVPVKRDGYMPLSYAQQRLWFLSKFGEASKAYHISTAVKLVGELDRGALVEALDRIVQRHESLRTTFVEQEGEPKQRIAQSLGSGFCLREQEVSAARVEGLLELSRIVREEFDEAFDLEHGPLIRGRLVRVSRNEHVLLVTMHHIISDGWSMGVLMSEFARLYSALSTGGADTLEPLSIQYADYALWQREHLQGDRLAEQGRYWQEHLAGAPELLDLPTDHPRAQVQSHAGDSVEITLDESLSGALRALSERHGTTLFMTLLAGWASTLSRLAAQEDVVIGTAVANRTRSEVEHLIGFFVNTLALRIDLSGDPSIEELLSRVKKVVLQGQSHQDIPFEQVVELVKPKRSLSQHALFQVMLVWQNATQHSAADRFKLPGLSVEPIRVRAERVQFDLTLSLMEVGSRITGTLRYATGLFERETIERYLGYWREVLSGLVSASARHSVSSVRMLSEPERLQVLEAFNATHAAYPQDRLIHELFEEQVRRTPDAVAVVYEQQQLSYAELNARANRLAHYLSERGVRAERLVAICIDRSVEMVVGLLGILKAGGAYVPLDPQYPAERLEHMLEDAQPHIVLTQAALKAVLPRSAAELIALDEQWEQIARCSSEDLPAQAAGLSAHSLAYVIYTSGSTGRPKGVMVEHRSVLNLWQALEQYIYRAHPQCKRVSLTASLSFDASVRQLVQLLSGRAVVIVPQAHRLDSKLLADYVVSHQIDGFDGTPSQLQGLLGEGLGGEHSAFPSLMLVGGEPIAPAQWDRMRHSSELAFYNVYGPTECTVDATAIRVREAGEIPEIGAPIANTQIYILDEYRQPVPVGVVGELYIGGAGVARGYLNRPQLSAERFVSDPFSQQSGARMYRTGDLGRWRGDGHIEFLGRNDHQVKIRGYRIELGEIEARLLQHPDVLQAVVVARQAEAGEQRLVAYCTSESGSTPSVEELRAHIGKQLPAYMMPAAIVLLESLPLTPNGKLDRKALPAPEDSSYARGEYEPPQGEVEEALASIWSELLKLERVGRHDDFFELGGHSLLAVTLIERMRRAGLHTDVSTVFLASKLSELASRAAADQQHIEIPANLIPPGCQALSPQMLPLVQLEQQEIDQIVAEVAGGVENIQDIYPLAPLQEGLLFHHLINEKGDTYLLSSMLAFDTQERLEAFLGALQEVIARHDILRTGVLWEGLNEPVQVVWREAALPVQQVQLQAEGEAAVEELFERFNPRRYRIDIRQAPLVRAFVAQDRRDSRWLLMLLSHHLVSDHTTLEIILKQVRAQLQGEPWSAVPMPFRNFVARARLAVKREAHQAFFTEMLSQIDEPTAPFGLLQVHGDGDQIKEHQELLEGSLAERIRACARAAGVSTASLHHLACAQVLSRLSGREQVVFGTVLYGRMQAIEGVEHALGMFINTLPVRIDIDDRTVRQGLRDTHGMLAQLMRHEHASLVLAQRCSALPVSTPLFTALFNYRHTPRTQREGRPAAKRWEGMSVLVPSHERTNYPFVISVDDLGEEFVLEAQVSSSLQPERICAYMREALGALVKALEQASPQGLRSIEVLPGAERLQVLEAFNATHAAYPQDRLIHELFEEQVRRTPDAVAVVYEQQQLSYAELNARANRLAHYLSERGVRAERLVAICIDRSVEMVVGLLGILKAGGAYVPLDPQYPAERLEHMLEDAQPHIVLTQAALKAVLPRSAAELIALDEQWEQIARCSSEDLPAQAAGLSAHSLAYVIYTSGSTGRPKGVMVEHRSVLNLWQALEQYIYRAHPQCKRVSLTASLSFDASVRQLVQLLSGRAVVIVPQAHRLDSKLLADYVVSHQIDGFDGTPSQLQGLLGEGLGGEHSAFPSLMLVGGEPIAPAQWDRMRHSSELAFYNVYGPTECTVDATAIRVREAGEIPEIGAPIANTQIYILDEYRQPVPVGVVGELYIGGAGVARGYLNRPQLSAERFVSDPFSQQSGARMYRTGDLGRWRGDGHIEFLGRNDHQVKIRGYRIELGEIEARLLQHPDVLQAVVVARQAEAGEQRLVAYCTSESTPSVEELRAHIGKQLPAYMMPAAIVLLESLPLTPNGKLDRKALPAPEDSSYARGEYEPPQGEVEEALASIWSELLKLERVGRHDDFFELGGHSLLAVTLIERMRRAGLHTDVSTVFLASKLSELASRAAADQQHIEIPANLIPPGCQALSPQMLPLVQLEQQEIDQIVAEVAGGVENIQDIYPLAPLQEGLLFHHLINEKGDTYLLSSMLAFDTQERLEAFLGALQEVIARHDILRTGVLWEGLNEPVQVVWREAALPVQQVQLQAEGEAAVEELFERFNPRRYRIDIRQAPLVRAFVAQDRRDSRWLLMLLSHHLVSDHTTLEIILKQVRAQLQGEPWSAVPMPFRNFVARARLAVKREAHQAFFTEMLSQIDEPTAPFGLLQVHGDGDQIKEHQELIEGSLAERIRACARAAGVSTASLHHLACAQVLSRLSGREQVVFGTVLYGRMQAIEGVEHALGMFINTLPVRIDIDDRTVRQGLRDTHGMLAQLMRHEHASLVLAQRCSALPVSTPLFTALFNYRHTPRTQREGRPAAKRWEGMSVLVPSHERTNYPFVISVDDLGEEFVLEAQVSSSLQPERICAYMREALGALVKALEQASPQGLRSIEVLPGAERLQVLEAFNATHAAYPQDRLIHELFEEQVRRTPDAVAVVYEQQQLSYAELNARANRLAHHLLSHGVQPGEYIPILMRRSAALIIAQLAVLKLGCAYVPLDCDAPTSRHLLILKECAPSAAISNLQVPEDFRSLCPKWIDPQFLLSDREPQHEENLSFSTPRDAAAYVMLTSGSTGDPKGIIVLHRGVVNLAFARSYLTVTSADCIAHSSNPAFDASTLETWTALINGAKLLIVSPAETLDPTAFADLLSAHAVTVVMLPTALFHQYASVRPWMFARPRCILIGGEKAEVNSVRGALCQLRPEQALVNLYGPTECTVCATSYQVKEVPPHVDAIPIGKPIANTQIYILDKYRQPVPVGVVGELYIGGAGVARGYLNRPQLSAERFVSDPFSQQSGARMYRTGDLGRWRGDGHIEFLGRNDHQVKIRGYRIELGEIEAQLSRHEQIKQAVVVVREEAGEQRLVAYCTSESTPSVEELRAHIGKQLPAYMMPAAIVLLESLPLTPNGKLDRKALPAPEDSSYARGEYEPPQGEVEEALASIWSELLKLERVGRHDDFFELGGHSLLAVKLSLEIRRQLGVEIELRHVLAERDLASLAVRVMDAQLQSYDLDELGELWAELSEDEIADEAEICVQLHSSKNPDCASASSITEQALP